MRWCSRMKPFLAGYDGALLEVRRALRGEKEQLRIGYLPSAFEEHLEPALKALRREHPATRVKLLDLYPGEQITALRSGEIDVAMTDQNGDLLGREFYTRKLCVFKSIVALPVGHRLAARKQLRLADLKDETFICGDDEILPGQRRHLIEMCRKSGKFTPRLLSNHGDLSNALAMVTNEDAVAILPAYMHHRTAPDVVMAKITDAGATWNLYLVWQRGRLSEPLRTLLDALSQINPLAARRE